jgi:hypothetical protein
MPGTTQVLEGLPCATRVSVCPEPPPDRKPPALLASCFLVIIGCGAFASGLSCPSFGFGAFAPVVGFDPAGALWEAAAFFLPIRAHRFWSSVISS